MQQNLLVYFRPKTDSFVEVGVNLNRISDQVKRIPYTVSNPQNSNWIKRGVCPPWFCLKTLTLRQLCVNLVCVNCEEVDFVTDRFQISLFNEVQVLPQLERGLLQARKSCS